MIWKWGVVRWQWWRWMNSRSGQFVCQGWWICILKAANFKSARFHNKTSSKSTLMSFKISNSHRIIIRSQNRRVFSFSWQIKLNPSVRIPKRLQFKLYLIERMHQMHLNCCRCCVALWTVIWLWSTEYVIFVARTKFNHKQPEPCDSLFEQPLKTPARALSRLL